MPLTLVAIACASIALAQPNPLPPPLAQWAIDQTLRNAKPVRVEVECIDSTTLSPEQIEADWQRVARFPDHPDRSRIESNRKLAANPVRTRMVWAFGGGPWYSRRATGDSHILEIAGDGQYRWAMSSSPRGGTPGRLSITAAGVPHPSGLGFGQYYMVLVQDVAKVGNYNIVSHRSPSVVHSSSATAASTPFAQWADGTKVVLERRGDVLSVIEHRKQEDGSVESTTLLTTSTPQSPPAGWPLPLFVPEFTIDLGEGRQQTWKVLSVEPLSVADLQAMVAIPKPPAGVTIVDHSRPVPIPEEDTVDAWYPDGRVIRLRSKDGPELEMWNIIPERLAEAPAATNASVETGDQPAAAASTPWRWWMAIAPLLLVLSAAVVIAKLRKGQPG